MSSGLSWLFLSIIPDLNHQQKSYIKYITDSQDTLQMGVSGHHTSHILQKLNKRDYFYNYLLIVDAYSKLLIIYGMETITSEEVMDNLDMFEARCRKKD